MVAERVLGVSTEHGLSSRDPVCDRPRGEIAVLRDPISGRGQGAPLTWEETVALARSRPDMRELVRLCYYDDPIADAAKRFKASEEWRAIAGLLPFANGTKVLDLGAGRGMLAWAFASSGCDVVALDPDQSDLVGTGAIERLRRASGVPMCVVCGYGEDLAFADNCFDYVVARGVMHHVAELELVAQEVFRVLRPGGKFLAIKEHVVETARDHDAFLACHPLHGFYGGERAYPHKRYLGALRKGGFRNIGFWGHFGASCHQRTGRWHRGFAICVARRRRAANGYRVGRQSCAVRHAFAALSPLAELALSHSWAALFLFGGQAVVSTIFILGGGGFLAGHIESHFARLGWRVVAIGRAAEGSAAENRYTWDLPHPKFPELLRAETPEICVNAAGSASVPRSMQDPLGDFTASTALTLYLLDVLRRVSPQTIYLHLSSAAVYGNPSILPICETVKSAPVSPYGWHRWMAEMGVEEFYSLYGLRAASLRIFSAYGARLTRQVVWDLSRRALSQVSGLLVLQGAGNSSRDFIHGDDVARAVHVIAERGPLQGECYNVASGIETAIRELAARILHLAGQAGVRVVDGRHQPGTPLRWHADISRLGALGFRPRIALQAGLRDVVAAVRTANENERMRA